MTSSTLKSLFDLMTNACEAEGGDGDVACFSSDYMQMADKFEAYRKEIGQPWGTRSNRDGFVAIGGNAQEAIYFSDSDKGFSASLTIFLPYGGELISK